MTLVQSPTAGKWRTLGQNPQLQMERAPSDPKRTQGVLLWDTQKHSHIVLKQEGRVPCATPQDSQPVVTSMGALSAIGRRVPPAARWGGLRGSLLWHVYFVTILIGFNF